MLWGAFQKNCLSFSLVPENGWNWQHHMDEASDTGPGLARPLVLISTFVCLLTCDFM